MRAVAVLTQADLKQTTHARLVFNDENIRHSQFVFIIPDSACGTVTAGNSTRKHAPCPGSLTSLSDPPCASTSLETIANPSPTPDFLVVTKGLKICSFISAGTPGPLSSISTTMPRASAVSS